MERRLAAILGADVVGDSRLMVAEETGTPARLEGLKAEIPDPRIARHRGRVIKPIHDLDRAVGQGSYGRAAKPLVPAPGNVSTEASLSRSVPRHG